jgi:Spy/CpxP family protein refolding chaperone
MKHRIIIACMIGLVTATAALATDDSTNAPPAAPRPPRSTFGGLLPPRLLDQLALTPEQKAKYDPLNADFKSDLVKLRTDNAESGTNAPVAGRQAMHELRKNYLEKVRAFLTPEQNATLDKAMRHGGGRGGPNGGPNAPPPPQSPPPGNN